MSRPALAALRLPPRKRRLRKQLQPDAVRLYYFAALRSRMAKAHAMVTERVLPLVLAHADGARADASDADRLRAELDAIAAEFSRQALGRNTLAALAREVATRTSDFQKAQLAGQLKDALGVDLFIRDAGLQKTVASFVVENVALVKTVPERYFTELHEVVSTGFQEGARASAIAADIEERYGVSESNALRLANDQVGKIAGQLNADRQQELGITSFVWRAVQDNRTREEHAALDGQVFTYEDPPLEGLPGEPVNCRCSAEPDVAALLE